MVGRGASSMVLAACFASAQPPGTVRVDFLADGGIVDFLTGVSTIHMMVNFPGLIIPRSWWTDLI